MQSVPKPDVDWYTEEERDRLLGGTALGGEPEFWLEAFVARSEATERPARASAAIVESFRAAKHDDVVWFGVPPARGELLKSADGIDFASNAVSSGHHGRHHRS